MWSMIFTRFISLLVDRWVGGRMDEKEEGRVGRQRDKGIK